MVPLSALPPIRFWLECTRRLNCQIYVESLFVDGMMEEMSIMEELSSLHKEMKFVRITTNLLTNTEPQPRILLHSLIKIASQ
ncbi:hypothetical protein C7433_104360 [Pantoea sp. PNA 03-3]|nr:hypothetical protein C7433_104360 [Pantoea sp. PNA 03-3]